MDRAIRDGDALNILQVNASGEGGGAERVAISLHREFRRRGHRSWLAVGAGSSAEDDVFPIPETPPGVPMGPFGRLATQITPWVGRVRGAGRARWALRMAERPSRFRDWWGGREPFDFPGTRAIPDVPSERPDVLHCHNLHGGYFDLRELPRFSRERPLVLTLHDEWSYTGHCAYTMGIERWRNGCLSCPDLSVYPRIRRDATHENWLAKQSIYRGSRLYVNAPSRWLLDRARVSVLAEGAAAWRLIPNGVDRSLFGPGDRGQARERLGLPRDAAIVLFAANRPRQNTFKDFETVLDGARRAATALLGRHVLAIALGGDGPTEHFENGELTSVAYERDPAVLAAYYQAADLYLHAARADNFPLTVLEALTSGLPVVATAVGGIPEQLVSLWGAPGAWSGEGQPRERATGVLVEPGDSAAMGAASGFLLSDDDLRRRLSMNARADAEERFDLGRQADATLGWYREVIADWRAASSP
jgi:glycosyltransferase involved in cell wall biosynthesis